MKNIVLLASLSAGVLGAADPGALKWADDFNQAVGTKPSPARWVYDLGANGWGNNELQNYTSDAANCSVVDDPLAVDGKALAIIALKTSAGGYTSARIKGQGVNDFLYGRVEVRARVPKGKGIWPAAWMLGTNISTVSWPTCGEIDIMEVLGHEPQRLYGTMHGPGYSGATGRGNNIVLTDGTTFADGYHSFAVQWSPETVRWFVDGRQYHQVSSSEVPNWVFRDKTQFVLLNLAVGGNWPGSPDATTVFPATYLIDYVRVYEEGPSTPAAVGAVAQTDGSVLVSWIRSERDGGAGGLEYQVEASGSADFSSSTFSAWLAGQQGWVDATVGVGVERFYRVRARAGTQVSAPSPAARVVSRSLAGTSPTARLVNVSARCLIGRGEEVGIVGFVATGEGGVRVLVRAMGPSLAPFGIVRFLPRPVLSVVDRNNRVVAANSGWSEGPQKEVILAILGRAGAFGFVTPNSTDAALLLDLEAGSYTAVVAGAGETTGVAIVEAYEVPRDASL